MAGDPNQMRIDLIMNDTQGPTTADDRKARRAAQKAERAFRESKGYDKPCRGKKLVGFAAYYALFGVLTFFAVTRHWKLLIPMAIAALVIGYVTIDGPADRVADYKAAVRDPMTADQLSPTTHEKLGIPWLTVVLAVLPPVLYILADLFLF